MSILLASCVGIGGTGELIINDGKNEINMAISGVDTYNPIKTKSKSVAEFLSLVYEPLFSFGEDLTKKSALAKDVTFSEDRLSCKITLSKDRKWHSGADFTADDVIYTINEIKNSDSPYKDNVKEIASAYKDADGSVVLSLSEPVMNIEGLLSFPIIRNGSAWELDNVIDGTSGLAVSEKTVHKIVLKPKEGGQASVSVVNVNVMRSDDACFNAFQMGEIDIISSSVFDIRQKTPGRETQTKLYTDNQMTFLGFNCSLVKYQEPSLRLAVSNIINRTELVERTMFDKATECRLPFNPQSSLYNIRADVEIDIDGVLNKAGYKKEKDSYVTADGSLAEISILVNIESGEKISCANIISAQLEKYGIKVSVEEAEYTEYKRRISKGEFDTFIGEVKMRSNLDPSFLTESGNMFSYSDEALTDILGNMRRADTQEGLVTLIGDYERTFSLNPPFVPIYYRQEGVVYKKEILGISSPSFYNSLDGTGNLYTKAKN